MSCGASDPEHSPKGTPLSFPVLHRIARTLILLAATAVLAGCDTVVLNPSGDIAAQQGRLVVISTVLMLLIIVPVIVLTLLFAWRYRAANRSATYEPDWDHSTGLELVIWSAPLLIIIALGAVTWISTHTLDPYRALRRIDTNRTVFAGTKPLVIEVVALDWKWLFIYPELGIATVNEVALPIDAPVEFRITATTVMNAFSVPALAGMIYAMPGMETQLHAVINKVGAFDGFSANYSGAGFSQMRFKLHGLDDPGFERWVQAAKAGGAALTREAYLQLEKPSIAGPARRYASVAPDLYRRILFRCTDTEKMCTDQVARIDAARLGSAAGYPVAKSGDAAGRRYVVALACTPDNPEGKPLALPPAALIGAERSAVAVDSRAHGSVR